MDLPRAYSNSSRILKKVCSSQITGIRSIDDGSACAQRSTPRPQVAISAGSLQVKTHIVDTDVIYRRAKYVWQVLTKDSECTVTTMGKSIGIS